MTKSENRMTNQTARSNDEWGPDMDSAEGQGGKTHDLQERTARFGEAVIAFAKTVPRGPITLPVITQMVRSGTSVGANYCEADNAESKKDYRHKIGICRKESRETQHWLRMTVAADGRLRPEAKKLWQEAKELNLIFSAIFRKSKAQ
jgi:four helix bundle protein